MTSSVPSAEGFTRIGNVLSCEGVALTDIARQWGTPAYVYSCSRIVHNIARFRSALSGIRHEIRYALKANSAAGILQLMAREGVGADTVSAGEIRRARRAGIPAGQIVFSGVGKTEEEIRYALLEGIGCFNIESEAEFRRLGRIAAECGRQARFSIRCNPDVDAHTHPYISTGLKKNKFGIPIESAEALYRESLSQPCLKAVGVDAHIGSQLLDPRPHSEAARKLIDLVVRLRADGVPIEHIDIGGGYGIAYEQGEKPPDLGDFFGPVISLMKESGLDDLTLMVEPGRAIVGDAGVLLTTVQYMKDNGARRFAVVDAGMNDLIRPALYSAWMRIEPLQIREELPAQTLDVVGPVCESSDFLGKDRLLCTAQGEGLVVFDAGAYGASMASRYNSRALPAELLIDRGRIHVLRERETFEQIIAGDNLIDL